MISKKKIIRENIFYPYTKKDYKKGLNNIIEAGFINKLLFFKLTFPHILKEENQGSFIRGIENYLISISFLNFAYCRYIENKNKKGGKIVMLIAFHSILGYDKTIKLYLSAFVDAKVQYLNKLSKIKKVVSFISKHYDYKNLYYYLYGARGYGMRYSLVYEIHKESKFQPNRFMELDYFSRYSNEKSIYKYLSREMYSVREKSHLSIINMWNVYMLINNLRYNPEDNKIYKRLTYEGSSESSYVYFSELDYLYKNIKKIWNTTIFNFKGYYDFPINELLSDYLQHSIQTINTVGLASMLLPVVNPDSYEVTLEEEVNYVRGFGSSKRIRESALEFKNYKAELDEEYKERMAYSENDSNKCGLFLTNEELKRKIQMDVHLDNITYISY